MKKLLVVLVVLASFPLSAQDLTAEYKTISGQLFLRPTAGGSALFQAGGIDYDVWLPQTAALASILNGSTVTVEGVFTGSNTGDLVAPVVHPYKITHKGRVIDLSTAFAGTDATTGATTAKGPAGRPGRRDTNSEGRDRRGYDDDDDDDDDDD